MSLFIPPTARASNANNASLSGAGWYFYETGTTDAATVYTTTARDTPHPSPVVADSGGLFPSIYLDPTVSYRAILKDQNGVEIADIDPYDPGASQSDLADYAASYATSFAATRTALAAHGRTGPVYLKESGREGAFVFDSSNLSSKVTTDTQQGIYVAPSSDTTGASGAWVRKFGSEPISVKYFGATGDGTTDDTAAITAALAYASGVGRGAVAIPLDCNCKFSSFSIPANVALLVAGKLTPSADADLITVGQNSKLLKVGAGKLDLSGLTAFTHSAIVIPSTAVSWLDSGSEVDIDIIGVKPGSLAPTGNGVEFRVAGTANQRASFCRVAGNILYFENGVYANIASPASGSNWATSNRVEAVFYDVVNAVKGSAPSANSALGAWIFGYVTQANTSKATFARALLWPGETSYGKITVWDVTSSSSTDNKPIEFTSASQRNAIEVAQITNDQVINNYTTSYQNEVRTFGQLHGYTQTRATPPLTLALPVPSGTQDDYLAYAGTRSGWTITASTAVSAGSTSNLFDPDPDNFGKWTALNGDLTIKIDMGATVARPHAFGVAFDPTGKPDGMKIEISADDVTYTLLYDKTSTGSVGNLEFWHSRAVFTAPRYIKFTFTNASAKDLIIDRIWGSFGSVRGNAFLERYQPNVETKLTVNGTQVLSTRKTGWAVDTGTAKRTANATYSGTAEAAYTQATIQSLMNAVRDLSQTVKALKDDLHGTAGHGLIGT